MEPILKRHFVNFKSEFEIETKDDPLKEASAFERFVNYVLLSVDYPDVFAADSELLEFVSVGGSDDTFIDGIGIAINDQLVQDIEEINEIVDASKKLIIDFVFIQSKMQTRFEISDLNSFGTGVKLFFSENPLPQNSKILDYRRLKDYIYSNEKVISKLQHSCPKQLLRLRSWTGEFTRTTGTSGRQTRLKRPRQALPTLFTAVWPLSASARRLGQACRTDGDLVSSSDGAPLTMKDLTRPKQRFQTCLGQ